MNNKNIDDKLFLERLSNLDSYERTFLLKLKRKYDYYNTGFKSEDDMKKAEDEIYTINGVKMSDSERIFIELSRIDSLLNKDENYKEIDAKKASGIASKMREISSFNKELNNNINDEVILNQLKKNISYIQIMLGINTNFFKATMDLMEDYYKNVMLNDVESKRVL